MQATNKNKRALVSELKLEGSMPPLPFRRLLPLLGDIIMIDVSVEMKPFSTQTETTLYLTISLCFGTTFASLL
jgi:hypothetical protein